MFFTEEQIHDLEQRFGLRKPSDSAPSNPPPAAPAATFASTLTEALERAIAAASAAAAAVAARPGASTSAQSRTPRYVPSFEEQQAQCTSFAAETNLNGWAAPWFGRAYTIHEPTASDEASGISSQMEEIELSSEEEEDGGDR